MGWGIDESNPSLIVYVSGRFAGKAALPCFARACILLRCYLPSQVPKSLAFTQPQNRTTGISEEGSLTERMGVTIIGDRDCDAHLTAIEQCAHVEHVPADARAPEPILHDPAIHAIAVCTPPAQRAYWLDAALASDRWVVTPLTSVPTARSASRLRVDAPLLWTKAEAELAERAGWVGDVSYVRARMRIPHRWLLGEGLLPRWGGWLVWLLQRCVGRLDVVQARLRNYRGDQPAEDHVLAVLGFNHGVEGHLEIDTLGDAADWQVDVMGSVRATSCAGDLRQERIRGLTTLYQSIGPHQDTEPAVGESDIREALFLSQWIRQSARLQSSLTRREARRT